MIISSIDDASQLQPVSHERLQQIIGRLFLHFRIPDGYDRQMLASHYAFHLREYPEDLLCAAYQHVLIHSESPVLPDVRAFITFIEPALAQRRAGVAPQGSEEHAP